MAKTKAKVKSLPPRTKVKAGDTWDLSSLFDADSDWEKAFKKWESGIAGFARFKGKLGSSAKTLAECLKFDATMDREGERLGVYASLKTAEDQGNSTYQRMRGRFRAAATKASEAASYIRPEIMAIKPNVMTEFLKDKSLKEWKLLLEQILRFRPHTLGGKEENLLAMQGNMSEASNQVFRQLNDADLKWRAIKDEKRRLIELSTSSFTMFLQSPKRAVRENAFHTFYQQYDAHKNTLAASYNASVQRDVYYARARSYKSALESALFPDMVPQSVYDNLVATVRKHLPKVHKYYDLRRRLMKLKDIHQYDTYVPILNDLEKTTTWDQAVKVVAESLEPLGDEYTNVLRRGLTSERWCDRYPNAGKQSGAFSSGSYDGYPYILMNYQPSVLDHVFTLAHEAGHSMHSWYSKTNQPYQYWGYTIFVAEVASTFNEQLLAKHMMDRAKSDRERAYLVNMLIDDIRGTIIRQTMFAEFEKRSHELVEQGEPLTVETLRKEYRALLDVYFGPKFEIDPELELECLRIPHFYRSFYVYKYATGLSAAIALSQRVLNSRNGELNAYLGFLKGGSSKYPLELLRDAGVDMEKPDAVEAAMTQFGSLVNELERLLG